MNNTIIPIAFNYSAKIIAGVFVADYKGIASQNDLGLSSVKSTF